jgi:hypothetical protein
MTIDQLAARVHRDAEALIAAIKRDCPAGYRPNPFVGYVNLAALQLAIAATETADGQLYVPDTEPDDIDLLVEQYATA